MRIGRAFGDLAIVVSVAALAGPVSAQQRETLPSPYAAPAQASLLTDGSRAVAPPYIEPPWVPITPPRHYHWNGPLATKIHTCPVVTWFHSLGCWSHINCYCCSSLEQENTFIFGSCKAFFGEPCLKAPPPMLVPPGYESSLLNSSGVGSYSGRPGCCSH